MVAFEALVVRKTPAVVSVARRIVPDSEDARDVAQMVFLRVWEQLDRYDEKYSFNTWLYRIATNLAIDFLRSARSRERAHGATLHIVRQREEATGSETSRAAEDGEVARLFRRRASGSRASRRRRSSCARWRTRTRARSPRSSVAASRRCATISSTPAGSCGGRSRRSARGSSPPRPGTADEVRFGSTPFPAPAGRRANGSPATSTSGSRREERSAVRAHLVDCAACRARGLGAGPGAALRASSTDPVAGRGCRSGLAGGDARGIALRPFGRGSS